MCPPAPLCNKIMEAAENNITRSLFSYSPKRDTLIGRISGNYNCTVSTEIWSA